MGYALKLLHYQIFCLILYLHATEGPVLYLTPGTSASVAMFVKSEFHDHLLTVATFSSGKNGVCHDVNDQVKM